MSEVKENRVGRFFISEPMLRDNPAMVRSVMARCVIVRCEMIYDRRAFEYYAYSPDYDEMPENTCAPQYDVTIDTSETPHKVTFTRLPA